MLSPSPSSKRRASRSPDNRPSKRHAPSTPEEGEVDDASQPTTSQSLPPAHSSLPPKPVIDAKGKTKVAFPFKKKKPTVETSASNVFDTKASGKMSPGRGVYQRPAEDDRRYGRDDDMKERRNGGRGRAGDHWEPSRRDRRSRSRSRSPSPSEKHRLPSRRSPESVSSPHRRAYYDGRRGDYDGRRGDYGRRPPRDEDRHYRPQPYRRSDDRDYEYQSSRRRSSSRGGGRRDHYDSYRPRSPPLRSPQDHARTPPGRPPPTSAPAFSPPSHSVGPLPPPLDAPPPPPPRTPPPIPPPDTRLSNSRISGLPEKPKALYVPNSLQPPRPQPPPAPRDAHSPPSIRYPAATDRLRSESERKEPPVPKEPQHKTRVVKRKFGFHPSQKEEEKRFGHVLEGCGMQDDYEALTKLGEGTFGEVHKALHKTTNRVVALKRILMHNEKEGMPVTALREIKILKAMKHPCVIEILDMFIVRSTEHDPMSVYMVFPYMDHDLAGLLENERVKLQPSHIKLYMKQLLEGTEYMHRNHILHRDMKAANLLISNTGLLRIADFGLARTYDFEPTVKASNGRERKYTNCVVTRWYRPPELLMGARNYGGEVDIWGIGCVLGEMFNRRPILPGTSDLDQLEKIWQLCGTPNQHTWPNFDALPGCEGIKRWNQVYPRKIKQAYETVGAETCDLLDKLLICNPRQRITAAEALDHDYFWTDPLPADPKTLPVYEASHEFDKRSQRMHRMPPPNNHPPRQHAHEPQHRALAVPHYHNANNRGPPPAYAQLPPSVPFSGPPPPHQSANGGPSFHPPSFPHPRAHDPRGPYHPPVGRDPRPSHLNRNPPYNSNTRHNRGPPRNQVPSIPAKLPVPGLPQRPTDPQGTNAPPPHRGDDSGGGEQLNYG